MKLFSTPKSQRDAMAPLITVSRLLGIRIFKCSRDWPWSILNMFYLSIHFCLACVSLYTQHKYNSITKRVKMQYFLHEVLLYFAMSIILCEMFLGWYHTKHLNVCYKKISKIDETLRQLGLTINYNMTYYMTIVAIIGWLTFIIVMISLHIVVVQTVTDMDTTIWLSVSQTYEFSISFVVVFEFAIFVRCLQIRFKLINQLLRESVAASSKERIKLGLSFMDDFYVKMMDADQREHFFPMLMLPRLNRQFQTQISTSEKRNSVITQVRPHLPFQLQKQFQTELQSQSQNQIDSMITVCRRRKHLFQILRNSAFIRDTLSILFNIWTFLRQVHLELCRVSKILCTSFGMQIASEIGLSIIFITEILYNLYARFVQHQNDNFFHAVERGILVFIIGSVYVLKVIYINHVCKSATDEGNKITEIIHEICGYYVDVDMRNEIHQFGLEISHSPVKFHTFGFSLDYNVLSSFVGMVTTYVVIMVQMSNSLEPKSNVKAKIH